MEGAVNTMTEAITGALSTIGTLATNAIGIITDNPVLMVYFCGGLLGVGFGVILKAKHAARG